MNKNNYIEVSNIKTHTIGITYFYSIKSLIIISVHQLDVSSYIF